jgi:acetyl-CoA C-acetyltransferase
MPRKAVRKLQKSVAIIAASATPCAFLQTKESSEVQAVEHEILGNCVVDAMASAGLDKSEIDSLVFTTPRTYTKQRYFGTFMANYLRISCSGVVMEVLGNGMTGGLAFDQAVLQIASGAADVALCLGISMETGIDRSAHLAYQMRTNGDVDFHAPFGLTPRAWYGLDAARYAHECGATREQLAMIAVKSYSNGALNPLATRRDRHTLEHVLAQPPIAEGMGLLEFSAPADGAVCLVLTTEDIARAQGKPYVLVRSRGFHHAGMHEISEVADDMLAFTAAARAAEDAYEAAGITAQDVDVAELYAASTIIEAVVSEAVGLVPRGQGAAAAAAGETSIGGRIPINPSGGLISRGHPAYVTPLYGIVELFDQLRGAAGARQVRDAGIGIMLSELGNFSGASVHVLEGAR